MTVSGPQRSATFRVAQATAGAVSFPWVSTKRFLSANFGNCSRTPSAIAAEVITQRLSQFWAREVDGQLLIVISSVRYYQGRGIVWDDDGD